MRARLSRLRMQELVLFLAIAATPAVTTVCGDQKGLLIRETVSPFREGDSLAALFRPGTS